MEKGERHSNIIILATALLGDKDKLGFLARASQPVVQSSHGFFEPKAPFWG
ncbi:MAG: hypothetical protein NWF01_08180 [Candidatus Bathyarchaeota archaeon]|nr:hypothetical protein [Candidatus Bathyarchaeota archaeon]